jgi:hypothetical protein
LPTASTAFFLTDTPSIDISNSATFFVDEIHDIEWNEHAFEDLVLPQHYKRLIVSFVESQISNKDEFDDFIQGKGELSMPHRNIIC